MMNNIKPSTLKPNEIYDMLTACCIPRPLYWGCTKNSDNSDNIAPFSFVTIASINPPHLLISIGKKRSESGDFAKSDTLKNIERAGKITLNTVSKDELDFLMKAYLKNDYSQLSINDSVLKNAPMALLCNYVKTVDEKILDTYLVLVKVDHILMEEGLDTSKMEKHNIVGCLGGRSFINTSNIIEL